MTRRMSHAPQSGFSLVVIAALFTAFSVVVAAVVERNTSTRQVRLHAQATEQLKKLSAAILRYTTENDGNYPCPARYNVPKDALDVVNLFDLYGAPHPDVDFQIGMFGKPATDTGTYPLYTPNCLTATYVAGSGIDVLVDPLTSGHILRGMVPVEALARYYIDPKDAFDPWGNRIMYVVNRQLTKGGSMNRATLALPTVEVKSTVGTGFATGPTNLAPVDYVLISYGRDKLGAIPKSATTIVAACTGTNPRAANCDGDAAFIQAPAFTGTNNPALYFDDILSYYRRE